MVKDGGGGKLDNARKVLVLQILAGVQAAAGQEGVLDAGGQEIFIAQELWNNTMRRWVKARSTGIALITKDARGKPPSGPGKPRSRRVSPAP